jgi:hypothetical protein
MGDQPGPVFGLEAIAAGGEIPRNVAVVLDHRAAVSGHSHCGSDLVVTGGGASLPLDVHPGQSGLGCRRAVGDHPGEVLLDDDPDHTRLLGCGPCGCAHQSRTETRRPGDRPVEHPGQSGIGAEDRPPGDLLHDLDPRLSAPDVAKLAERLELDFFGSIVPHLLTGTREGCVRGGSGRIAANEAGAGVGDDLVELAAETGGGLGP